MASGAPGDVPEGNCKNKCSRWLMRCNDDPNVDALAVLGQVIQKLMDLEPGWDSKVAEGQARIIQSLARTSFVIGSTGTLHLQGQVLRHEP